MTESEKATQNVTEGEFSSLSDNELDGVNGGFLDEAIAAANAVAKMTKAGADNARELI